ENMPFLVPALLRLQPHPRLQKYHFERSDFDLKPARLNLSWESAQRPLPSRMEMQLRKYSSFVNLVFRVYFNLSLTVWGLAERALTELFSSSIDQTLLEVLVLFSRE